MNKLKKKHLFFNEVQNSSCSVVYLVSESFREMFITSLRWEKDFVFHAFAAPDLCLRRNLRFSKTPHCTAPLEDFWVGPLTQVPGAAAE